jgi:hypothetical protein
VSVVETFFLAMALYPDIQRKAQEEIDRVCMDVGDGEFYPFILISVGRKAETNWKPKI